ncbi:Plant self-incompatibility S1 [Dillenia turbinata]|uniref:S-protein homolog n=1 Tax=Dillenia turbinata TaxID=194707 RepID=A0AAN8VID7_9MAGN
MLAIMSTQHGVMAFFLLVLIVGQSRAQAKGPIPEQVIVHVKNGMEDKSDITIHCKTIDDDLGEHLLHINDELTFDFRPNIFSDTIYTCSSKWLSQVKYFDLYKHSRDECGDCSYVVDSKGDLIFVRVKSTKSNDGASIQRCDHLKSAKLCARSLIRLERHQVAHMVVS